MGRTEIVVIVKAICLAGTFRGVIFSSLETRQAFIASHLPNASLYLLVFRSQPFVP